MIKENYICGNCDKQTVAQVGWVCARCKYGDKNMKETIEKLKAVICDPEGKPSISGTEGDLQVINECLAELEDHDESLRVVRNSLLLKTATASLRAARIERLELHVEKLKQLILLTDPAVHDVAMSDLTMRQWNEYSSWCDELEIKSIPKTYRD